MTDLDRRLGEGPLRVQSFWSPQQTAALPGRVLRLRRRRRGGLAVRRLGQSGAGGNTEQRSAKKVTPPHAGKSCLAVRMR